MEDSDRRQFVPSPSPVEEFEGDADQEWAVAGIVGQSIDVFGEKRYEVKWGEGWTRRDGTNTTWEKPGGSETVDRLIRRWDLKQAQKRAAKARESPEIAVGMAKHQMLHEDRTFYELVQGYREVVRAHPEPPDGFLDFDGTLKTLRPVGAAGTSEGERERSRSRETSSPVPPRAVKPLPRRARRAISSPPSSEDETAEGSHRRLSSRREALQKHWAKKLCGSAPVTFMNEVNAEDVPYLVDGFEYIERAYVRAPDVPANDLSDCLVSCECDDRCSDAEECGCQDPSELKDETGKRIYVYSKKRLFNFKLPPGMEAIECNKSCSCDEGCQNRVAQLPRDVPIEIFRTPECGWGASATVPLVRGKVVGIYTGQLIRREEADRRHDERRSYIFDLDVHESAEDDEEEHGDRFSVDGYAYGNWTRFVNHSCEPNMRVFPVVWDTIPELNQPYLAFVTTADIPARTELTIDYDPKAGEEARSAKQKGRRLTTPEGARECKCGTESCRGWVRV
ncbi:SET domain-containing protein [Cubamyces sp. BRFM 1775]|nr:SET domain-containing protein [Cubamyces sp. BRFM 1775]